MTYPWHAVVEAAVLGLVVGAAGGAWFTMRMLR